MGKKNEIAVIAEDELVMHDIEGDSLSLMKPADLRAQMKTETKKREILTEYINTHFKDGVDFGRIHIANKTKCPEPWSCTNKYHYSKPTLFKPGAEKFTSLFRLTVKYERDTDTWEMLGSEKGTIALIARMYTANGQMVGEGRGVCSTGEKEGKANSAVKIAQKRAKIDAVLSSGGLSDFFTQDMEEDEYKNPIDNAPKATEAKALERMILDGIDKAKSVETLITIDTNTQASAKLGAAFKKKVKELCNAKVSQLENVGEAS